MESDPVSPRWAASLGASALVLALGWFAFVEERRVPLLGLADLGVHELGHLLFMLAPPLVTAVMGNGLQTLMPLLVAAGFGFARRDWPAVGFCLGWAGTTMQDASVYIADAYDEALPLLFGDEVSSHDWAYILGPEQLGILERAGSIAAIVHDAGTFVLIVGLCACMGPALLRQYEAR